MRRIGVLMNLASDDPEAQARIAAFRQELQQLGWTDGRDVRIDYRWAGRRRSLSQICRGASGARAGRHFGLGHPKRSSTAAGEPHRADRLRERRRPGRAWASSIAWRAPAGTPPGLPLMNSASAAKWLELLKEIAPRVTRVAVLRDLTIGPAQLSAIQAVAPSFGVELSPVGVRDAGEIERTIAAIRALLECRHDRDPRARRR